MYKYFQQTTAYKKLVGTDYLFVEYKCPINAEKFQLWFESHLILFVINGKKDWITPEKTHKIKAGDALFVRKGVYTTKQYFEEEYCVLLFFLSDAFIKQFMFDHDLFSKKTSVISNNDPIFEINTNDSFQSLIQSIFHYFKRSENIPQSLVELKFKELLFNIALDPKNRKLLEFFNSVNQSTRVNIEEVMLKNFQYDLKLEEFAKLCGRSLSTFKRDFKNRFQTTPSKWLQKKRLEYSKTLLVGSDLSVNEVCYESGFKNPSHFVRVFKDRYQLPPNQFKTAYLQGESAINQDP